MAPRFVKLDDIKNEIREHAKQFQKRAAERPVAATLQGPASTPLRVTQVAPPGTELALTHPSRLVK